MKARRFKETPRDNASKGHLIVFNILKEMFPLHEVYQEYPYSKILEIGYKDDNVPEEVQDSRLLKLSRRLHADIYDATIRTIFEIQGEQHFSPVIRDKKESLGTTMIRFSSQQGRDQLKRLIANEAKVKLLEISYKDLKNINSDYIWNLISKER